MNRRWLFCCVILLLGPSFAGASSVRYCSDHYPGRIYRLEDLNGDDDALDAGEKRLWGQSAGSVMYLTHYRGGLLATDYATGRVLYLKDLDGDNDVDEHDFAAFAGCVSGAGTPADPGCWP